jgi:hypothetical protein
MERQYLLYLDTCVFSNLLDPKYAGLLNALRKLPHRIAFSNAHIAEMQGNAEGYGRLLDDLDALFVRNPGDSSGHYHPISSLDPADTASRFYDSDLLGFINAAFAAMCIPLQHFMGGRREQDIDKIADLTHATMKANLEELLCAGTEGLITRLPERSYQQLCETTELIRSMDVLDGWRQIDSQLKSARNGDPMRNMSSKEKVEFLFSTVDAQMRLKFEEMYPKNFASKRALEVGEVGGFAALLFSLGLVKRRGIFSGPSQEKNFVAQQNDFAHIEAGSRCDVFLTFDKGASELAAASYTYAGFPTVAILLTKS